MRPQQLLERLRQRRDVAIRGRAFGRARSPDSQDSKLSLGREHEAREVDASVRERWRQRMDLLENLAALERAPCREPHGERLPRALEKLFGNLRQASAIHPLQKKVRVRTDLSLVDQFR